MTLPHALHVAVYSGYPILGLLHDAVEDGWLPEAILPWWPALDALTRRKGEVYADYIERVAENPAARKVKITDLFHNLTRGEGPSGELNKRYVRALVRLMTEEIKE
jgi:hypothetical protein